MAQYKSIDLDISTSRHIDDYMDTEFVYEGFSHSAIVHWGLGFSHSVKNNLVLSPRVAYSVARHQNFNAQSSAMGGSIESSTFVQKRKTITFFKLGVALSYWINKPGKGLFIESELQNLFLLSAISNETRRFEQDPIQNFTVDFEDELNTSIPSFRIGAGYDFPVKKFSFFVRLSQEFRVSTYFNTTDNYTLMSRSIGFGFKYFIQKEKSSEE